MPFSTTLISTHFSNSHTALSSSSVEQRAKDNTRKSTAIMCKTVVYKFLCLKCGWRLGHRIDKVPCAQLARGGGLYVHGSCGTDELIEVTRKKDICEKCMEKRRATARRFGYVSAFGNA
ncbi:hypothetical protein FDECE_7180 [Fusarium decemcellulare]|nr:hypothetical protein FDECE_7180 [Fusarium decemcellulare]